MDDGYATTDAENLSYLHRTQKVRHECSYCGFELMLYECSAVGIVDYDCPICHIGTLSRVPNVTFGPNVTITVGPSEVKHDGT